MSNPTAREWLAARKLAIAGARGKFSKDALKALNKAIAEGQSFSDWDENGRIKPVHVPRGSKPKPVVAKPAVMDDEEVEDFDFDIEEESKPRKVYRVRPIEEQMPFVRKENVLSVIDAEGVLMNVGQCSQGHAIRRCTCSDIQPPKWMKAELFELLSV